MIGQLTTTAQRPPSARPAAQYIQSSWRALAVAAYQRAEPADTAALAADLAARVASLTGYSVAPELVLADRAARRVSLIVDGLRFQLHGGQLTLLRPCVECGLGAFASPPIAGHAGLGYALAEWEPRCPHCPPDDQEDWASW